MPDNSDDHGATASRRFVLQASVAAAALAASPAQAASAGTVLITGSSRGIGFEFAKRYAETNWDVIATARDPEKAEQLQALAKKHKSVRLETLDVTDLKSIDALAAKLQGTPIDLLLNNAGISGGANNQIVGTINYDVFDDVMHTNVRGPIKMVEAFTPHVAASKQKKIVNISSTEGSMTLISPRPDVNSIFYRASKSALNMVMINMAKALKDKGIIITMQSPGLVSTDFVGTLRLPIMITPEQSVAMTMPIIEKLTIEQSGQYFRHTGEVAPW